MLRTILLVIIAILYLLLTLPVLLVLMLIRKKNPETCGRIANAMIRWIFRVIGFFAGAKVTVRGLEHIPEDQAVLYVANHRSIFDIILVHPIRRAEPDLSQKVLSPKFRCSVPGANSSAAFSLTATTCGKASR